MLSCLVVYIDNKSLEEFPEYTYTHTGTTALVYKVHILHFTQYMSGK